LEAHWGKPINVPVKMEIVLNAFTGYCYVCKEKGDRVLIVLTKKSEAGGTERHFNGNCNQCGYQGHKKSEFQSFEQR